MSDHKHWDYVVSGASDVGPCALVAAEALGALPPSGGCRIGLLGAPPTGLRGEISETKRLSPVESLAFIGREPRALPAELDPMVLSWFGSELAECLTGELGAVGWRHLWLPSGAVGWRLAPVLGPERTVGALS